MKFYIAKAFAFILLFHFLIVMVFAQLTSLPVSFSPKEDPGLNTLVIHGDFAFNHKVGDFKTLAGRIVWNPGRFSLIGGAGILLSDNNQISDGFTAGIGLGFDIETGSQLTWKPIIQIKGAIGYTKIEDLIQWNFPLACGFALILPPPFGNIKVWAAPRLHFRTGDNLRTLTNSDSNYIGAGLSGGLTFTSKRGPGLHLDFEYLRIESHNEFIVAVGIHWDLVLSY